MWYLKEVSPSDIMNLSDGKPLVHNGIAFLWTEQRYCYFFASTSVLTFWIPSRITSLLVFPRALQHTSKSEIVRLSARILSCISFGLSTGGRPVRGLTKSPLFLVYTLIIYCVHKESQEAISKYLSAYPITPISCSMAACCSGGTESNAWRYSGGSRQ